MTMRLLSTAIIFILFIPVLSQASTFERGDRIHITNIHEIDDDFYAFGSNITIDGRITGDLVLGGQEVSTNGKIGGSINVFSETFTHTGGTRLSLRAFANKCRISGYVGGSIIAMGSEISIDQSAHIGRQAHLRGKVVTVDGRIENDLTIHAERIYVSGQIEGNVHLEGEHIKISAPAVISGNLTYESKNEIEIDEVGVTILGTTEKMESDESLEEENSERGLAFVWGLSQMLAAFLFAILMIYMFRRYALVSFGLLRNEFAKSFAVGILTLFVMGLSIIVLAIALAGIILGLIFGSGTAAILGSIVLIVSFLLVPITSFLSVSGAILLYCGGILFAILVGSLIFVRSGIDQNPLSKLKMFAGLLILTLINAIPYLGFIFCLLAVLSGAGAIVMGVRNCRADGAGNSSLTAVPPQVPLSDGTE